MPFNSYADILNSYNTGKSFLSVFRKVPSTATAAGIWIDLSMSPGYPGPFYYASSPLVASVLSSALGIQNGGAVSPDSKRLTRLMVTTTVAPVIFTLCDYVLYYPYCDMGDVEPQIMDNTVTLPRYTDGENLEIMPVIVAPQLGSTTFYVTYTNSQGVSGRVTKQTICNTQAVNGTIVCSSTTANASAIGGPFLPKQDGDTGIRSIDSFVMMGADIGLITLVLVRPLVTFYNREIGTPAEVDYPKDKARMPRIYDGAFLGLSCMAQSSLASVAIQGELEFIWN